MEILDQLKRPFEPHLVHWRVGNTNAKKLGVKPWEATEGSALAYIDARDVMQRLDSVAGPENWQVRYPMAAGGLLICDIGIRASVFGSNEINWIWKANGAGDTQVEAEKGKCSDAMKRAAVLWGVGRYLYQLPFAWGAIINGKLAFEPQMPDWATPEGYDKRIKLRDEKEAENGSRSK